MAHGPLRGVRIVDLGRGDAARLAASVLGDLGAELARDFADPSQLLRWLDRCDLVIDDGGLATLGIDPGPIRAGNPGLVVLKIPFDAEQSGAPPSGAAAGALAGVYAPPLSRTPRWTPIPVVSTLAGLSGALGAVAALVARERDGRGQVVTVPLVHAGYAAVETLLALSHKAPSAWQGARWAGSPFVGPYRCSDGRWVFAHLGLAHHVDQLLALLAAEGLIRQGAELKAAISPETRADPSAVATPAEATAIRALLEELFDGRPAETWEALLGGAGLCCAVARSGAEWRSSEQALAAGHVVDGAPGLWIHTGHTRPIRPGGAPRWAVRKAAVSEPDTRAPLAGFRVLDFTQVIAGPVAGRALAELGADVIRIEHPGFRPAWSEAFHAVFNRGKRSATVDLDPTVAKAILEELKPDVVLSNWRTGVDARLGLDPVGVRAVCPDAVVLRLNAWGEGGPWSDWPGWEQTVQAGTGLQLDYGDGIPELVPLPINDEATGLAAAVGAVAALLHRSKGRGGLDVHTSLAATATWLQRDWLFGPSGRVDRAQRGQCQGSAEGRFLRASDGWLWLEGDWAQVRGLEAVEPGDSEALVRAVAKKRVAHWVKRCAELDGVSCSRWNTLGQAAASRGAPVERVDQPGVGTVTRVHPPLQLERTPLVALGPASTRGSDRHVLGEIPTLEPDAVHDQAIAARIRRRAEWVAVSAQWGLWLLRNR